MPHTDADGYFTAPPHDTTGLTVEDAGCILRRHYEMAQFTETTYGCDVCGGPVPKSGPELCWIAGGQEAAHSDDCPAIGPDDPRAALTFLLNEIERLTGLVDGAKELAERELTTSRKASGVDGVMVRVAVRPILGALNGTQRTTTAP